LTAVPRTVIAVDRHFC